MILCIPLTLVDAVARPMAAYGMGASAISLDNLACTGDEERLIDCVYPPNVFCTHAEDAGIDCSENCELNYTCRY